MSAQSEVTTSSAETVGMRGLLPIALGTLVPADRLDFDLFIQSDADKGVLFRGRNYPLGAEDIQKFSDASVKTLYIRVAEHEAYCEYLKNVVLNDSGLPPTKRVQVLMAVNRSAFEAAFQSPNVVQYVEFAEEFGTDLVNTICESDVALSDLTKLMSHDYYTYTHVVNVTTYCLMLARELGIDQREALQQITVGALLHDYGKRFIPASVLNTAKRLTDEQWVLIRDHPGRGFREFCLRDDLTWGQLMMIYQHHERPDGKGYPAEVGGSEIHEWARICKVADVFDALTSDRPYRNADSLAKVMTFIENKIDSEFDKETVRCFQAMINCKN